MPNKSPSTTRFEPLREDHLEAVLAIEKRVNSAAWSERAFRAELDHSHGLFLVVFVEGKVVGYGGLWLLVDEAHITTVALAPEFQGQGLGGRLVAEMLRRAKAQGMICATLEVRAGNTSAIRLYEKLGFVNAGVRKKYYPDNREDAVIMWLYSLDAID